MATEVAFTDDTRQIIRTDRTVRQRFVIGIKPGGDKDSGTVKVQFSFETSPSAGDDNHWWSVEGLTDIVVGQIYPINGALLRATSVAVKCSAATPSLTIRMG